MRLLQLGKGVDGGLVDIYMEDGASQVVKNLPTNARDIGDVGSIPGSDPWVRKIPWRRAWQYTPVFLPGQSHGQKSLVGYSPWDCKESDTTEVT